MQTNDITNVVVAAWASIGTACVVLNALVHFVDYSEKFLRYCRLARDAAYLLVVALVISTASRMSRFVLALFGLSYLRLPDSPDDTPPPDGGRRMIVPLLSMGRVPASASPLLCLRTGTGMATTTTAYAV